MDKDTFRLRAISAFVLNILSLIVLNLYFHRNFSTYMKNVVGGLIILNLFSNYEFVLKRNPFLLDKENIQHLLHYFKIFFLLYNFMGYFSLYFFTRSQELRHYQIFISIFYFGAFYALISLFSFKKDIRLKIIQKPYKPVKWIIELAISIVVWFLVVGILNIIFLTGKFESVMIGIMFSTYSFTILLCLITAWIIVINIYDRISEMSSYWTYYSIVLILIIVFSLPLILIPNIIRNTNRDFQDVIGDNWDDFPIQYSSVNTEDDLFPFVEVPPGIYLDTPFSLLSAFFGENTHIIENIHYNVEENLLFSESDQYKLYFDVYFPTTLTSEIGIGANKTIIYLHGGGWTYGNRNSAKHIFKHFAAQGYVVFTIDYRLLDEKITDTSAQLGFDLPNFGGGANDYRNGIYNISDMLSDVGNFTYYLSNNPPEERYYADLSSVSLMGDSAGAYLAAIAGLGFNEPFFSGILSPELNISNIILYYPPNLATELFYENKAYHNDLIQMIDGTPQSNPDAYFYYTPSNIIDLDDPNILILHGNIDDMVSIVEGEAIFNKARKIGLKSVLIRIQIAGHGFSNNPLYDSLELYYIERWLYALS